jgi:2-methylcitrate dehydratase PrpD
VATTRLTEIDDIHCSSCVTAGAVVIPTAVIMARALGATSAQFAQALRNGYETMMRLGNSTAFSTVSSSSRSVSGV